MTQFHFDPVSYGTKIRTEVPAYDELQRRLADATAGVAAGRILDLGAGTGATSRALRGVHPEAAIVAVDESPAMLSRIEMPGVETLVGRLQDELPEGPFDVVASALAVHHLDPAEKRDLFARVREVLGVGGRFVLGDVVVAGVVVAPLSKGYDKPDTAANQLDWLRAAGFVATLLWERDDLALLCADRP